MTAPGTRKPYSGKYNPEGPAVTQTQRLAALARVAANPAIDQPHLGNLVDVAASSINFRPGDILIHVGTAAAPRLINTLIAWGYLLDRPTVTLIDLGGEGGVHIHLDGYLAGDHVAAWSGVQGSAADLLRAVLDGQKRLVVPLYVLRSTAVRLVEGAVTGRG